MFLNLKLPRASEVLLGNQMLGGWISRRFNDYHQSYVGGGALGHQIFKHPRNVDEDASSLPRSVEQKDALPLGVGVDEMDTSSRTIN